MNLLGYGTWSLSNDEVQIRLAEIDALDNVDSLETPPSDGPFNVFHMGGKPLEASVTVHYGDQSYVLTDGTQDTQIQSSRRQSLWLDNSTDDLIIEQSPGDLDQQPWESPPRIRTSLSASGLSPAIFQYPIIRRLMDNYVRALANILPPLSHPESPFSTIYIPNALEGASNSLSDIMSPGSKTASLQIAIFYALLATSAFHLRGPDRQNDSEFETMASHFKSKAFASLRQALPGPSHRELGQTIPDRSTTAYKTTAISAMLTLVTMDIMEGSMSEYWIHLAGVKQLVTQLSSGAEDSRQVQLLITISSFLSIVAKTTSVDLPALPWTTSPNASFDTDHQNPGLGYGLEFTYGITSALASHMERIVILSQHLAYYATNSLVAPSPLLAACVELSERLSAWSIDSEPLSELLAGTTPNATLLLPRHHILAFAYGLRVYYHTRILPCSPAKMRLYVDRVARELIEIENLKTRTGGDSNTGTTITWPGFVASCEAESGPHRRLWHQWWGAMLRYRIGNINLLWGVVQEAWRLRDAEESTEVPAWMPVLRRRGQRILAV